MANKNIQQPVSHEQVTSKGLGDFLKFMHHESAAGIGLILATIFAMLVANSEYNTVYKDFLSTYIPLGGIEKPFKLSIEHWINDGLMALFFLFVGLEIKREAVTGHLSSKEQLLLPTIAAVGGVVFPALIFFMLNRDNPYAVHGWAIPAATDIAFALGVISLLGSRVPVSVKIFLTALAVIDDLAAIVIIALFYTKGLNVEMLTYAGITLGVLIAFNRARFVNLTLYLLTGAVLWYFVYKSGLHATLAGVALAFTVPIAGRNGHNTIVEPLETLEHGLAQWVNFIILPLFAFANAGVSFAGMSINSLLEPIPLGIAAGLVIGKQIGVFGFAYAAIKSGVAAMPSKATWSHVYGASILTGIGFTMSLFISNLAYDGNEFTQYTRLGVLSGSAISAVLGYAWLRFVSKSQAQDT